MLDARARITGRVDYVINHELPGMLHARLLRSIHPHALIRSVDATEARQVPGVHLVVSGADVVARGDVGPYFGPVFRDQAVLAIDRARFAGDPVAAVVADSVDAANEALRLIDVDYDPQAAVFDPLEALAEGAPLVHPEPPRMGATFADLVIHTEAGSNVCNYFKLRKGDVDAALASADYVFEDTFRSPAVQHVPLETHACVADVRDGHITVWTGVQTPHLLRSQLAEMFGVPLSAVRVIVPTMGGSYGSKCYLSIEPLTAVLAYLSRRPVRLHLSREEEFVTITKHAAAITLATGVRRDGTIVARKSTCYFNTGAYADIGPRLIKNAGYATGGPHAIPDVSVDSYAVYTNLPPAGAFRGYGVSQAAWAFDSQLDLIAARLGLDPYVVRRQNLLVDGQTFATGDLAEDCHFVALLDAAADGIDWQAGAGPEQRGHTVRAKGLSCVTKSTATPSTSTAVVKLNEDGSVSILTSSVEMGQGLKTAMALIAATELGVSVERVSVSDVDTDVTPYDQQTSSSRSTYAMGTAVSRAMAEIRAQLVELGADHLEAARADLEVAAGSVRVRGAPEKSVALGELVRASRSGNLLGTGVYQGEGGLDPETGQGIGSVHWHQAAGAAEVEVDLETGKVDIVRYHAAVYAGRIINPVQAELQTEGCVAFGLGQVLFEEMVLDGGQLQNGNLGDYMIASIEDMPPIGVSILEHPDRLEIHGIGETSLPPVMAAVGNAVFRATGARIHDLPITPEKVLRALRAKQAV
jgi:CO/xanthine dehydrogenase Mo-binding subunit